MFRTHKIFTLALVSLAFLSPGCDEDVDLESDEQEMQAAIDDEDLSAERSAEPVDDEDEPEEFSEGLPDDRAAEVHPVAAHCTGYYEGGNYCLALCNDSPVWRVVGHLTTIPYGTCESAGDQLCAWHKGRAGSCWGVP